MASIEYSLFRAKFIRSRQQPVFSLDLTPEQLFVSALEEKPSGSPREGHLWHIGNVRLFTERTGYFACGRTTKSTIEKFDKVSGDFLVEELEASLYTHCVFNAQIGILGIARKSSLAPTVKGIATHIQQLLSRTKVIATSETRVEIAPIPDPEDFLHSLESAYAVTGFSATFHGPNPFDADEFFQKPLSVYLHSANGKSGRAHIRGEDLSREVVQSVARSTAATGNEASARIRKKKAGKATTVHLRGDPARTQRDENDKPEAVLSDLEKLYERVRER